MVYFVTHIDTELDFKSKLDEITKALGPLDKPVIYTATVLQQQSQ